ncbi:MAG: lipopolysaccharide biosynthesis protein [Acidobacteriota bacterium]
MIEAAPAKGLGGKAKRGVAWSFLREGVTEFLVFPASMVMARLLTPQEFGIAAAANFFILMAERLSVLGLNAALIRAKVLSPAHLSSVFVVNLAAGAVMFATLAGTAPLVAAFYRTAEVTEILPIAALGFLLLPFGTVPAALLAREMRFRESTLVDWYYTLTYVITTIVLAWLGFSYMSMVYGRLAAIVAMTLSRMVFARWRPALALSVPALREMLSFGAGVYAKRLLDYTAQNVDNLVVGKYLGMAALGLYDRAFSSMNRCLARLNSGGPGVTFRIFAIIQEDPARFRRAYQKVLMSTTLLAYPLFAVLIAVAPQFMVVMFGETWRPAAAPFQVLCLAGCLKLLNTYASSASQAAGRVWSEVWRQLLYVTIIVGSIIALRAWGPVGAAAGVLCATFVMTALMHVLLIRVTHLEWGDILRPQLPALLCASGSVAVVLAVEHGIQRIVGTPPSWILLMFQAFAAMVFYAAFVLLAPHAGLRALVRDVAEDLVPPVLQNKPWVKLCLAEPRAGAPSSASSTGA